MASFVRARGGKTQEFFDIERQQIGRRSVDLELAKQVSRDLDTNIDAIFPAWRTVANKQTAKKRNETLDKLNELLLSGKPVYRDWETDRKSTRLNSSHRL